MKNHNQVTNLLRLNEYENLPLKDFTIYGPPGNASSLQVQSNMVQSIFA